MLHLEPKIKIIEKDNIQGAIPSPGGSPREEAAGSLDQGILAFAVFAHKTVSHLETHIKSRVNHQSSELGADSAGNENFSADFNLGKHLLQLTDRHQAPGQGTHALHLLSCIRESVALQRGGSLVTTEDHRIGSLGVTAWYPCSQYSFPCVLGSLWIARGKEMDCGLSDTGELLASSVLTKPEGDAPQVDQISPIPPPHVSGIC